MNDVQAMFSYFQVSHSRSGHRPEELFFVIRSPTYPIGLYDFIVSEKLGQLQECYVNYRTMLPLSKPPGNLRISSEEYFSNY